MSSGRRARRDCTLFPTATRPAFFCSSPQTHTHTPSSLGLLRPLFDVRLLSFIRPSPLLLVTSLLFLYTLFSPFWRLLQPGYPPPFCARGVFLLAIFQTRLFVLHYRYQDSPSAFRDRITEENSSMSNSLPETRSKRE